MKITVERIVSDADTTIGTLYIDSRFQAFILEDEFRQIKVASDTRIPAGDYRIKLKPIGSSRFDVNYTARFGADHAGMLEVCGVPGFEGVLFHIGNTDADTAGCLLVGESATCPETGRKTIGGSTAAYLAFYRRVVGAARDGQLELEIIDRDR